jgi:hypothetical protein
MRFGNAPGPARVEARAIMFDGGVVEQGFEQRGPPEVSEYLCTV